MSAADGEKKLGEERERERRERKRKRGEQAQSEPLSPYYRGGHAKSDSRRPSGGVEDQRMEGTEREREGERRTE
jgi:hypothetical protein